MNSSQLQLFLRKPLLALQTVSMRILMHRSLILIMAALQLIWLLLIAVTGASTQYDRMLTVAIFSVVAIIAVTLLPGSAISKIRSLKSRLLSSEKQLVLFLCLVALLVGFLYSTIQTQWTDEIASLKAAKTINSQGLIHAYKTVGWLGEQHPPLFSLIFALTLKLPGPDLLLMRMVSVLFLAGTLSVTYFIGRELYSREIGYLAAILLLSFPLVIRLSSAAMMDIQLAFFFCFALLLLIRLSKTPSYWLACATGTVIGLGLLTKYIMIFVFLVLFSCFLFCKNFQKIVIHMLVAGMVSLSVFSVWILYANHTGILARQFQKILNFTGSYHLVRDVVETSPIAQPQTMTETESVDAAEQMQNGIFRLGLESLFTRIPSSLGVYHAPLILFGLLSLLKRRQPADLMILLWIGAVSLSLFITLPDHRYFLPIFPAIAIVIAHVLLRFPDYAERAILVSLLFGAGNLYLFANWLRESHLFLLTP